MKKIVITGVTGFVGRRLCMRIKETTDWEIYGIGRREPGDLQKYLSGYSAVDLTQTQDFSWLPAQVDAVVHLAARVHMMQDHPQDSLPLYQLANYDVTKNLYKAALARGMKRFVFLSTIKVNGEETHGVPFSASQIAAPQDAYAISKKMAEDFLLHDTLAQETENIILRPPLIYGPGVKANFLKLFKLVEKVPVLPFASIINQRSFIFVENLCDAVVHCLRADKMKTQAYTLADCTLSTPELLREIAKALHKNIVLLPMPVDWMKTGAGLVGRQDIVHRLTDSLAVDSSEFTQSTGWVPPIPFTQGLLQTANWYKGL